MISLFVINISSIVVVVLFCSFLFGNEIEIGHGYHFLTLD